MNHPFSLFNKFSKDGVIDTELPSWNKYCNEQHVTTTDKPDSQYLDRVVKLVNHGESLNNNDVRYVNQKYIQQLFHGFNNPIYISFYSPGKIDEGCLTSRPIKVRKGKNSFQAYFLDLFYIAKSASSKKQTIETHLFQTHEFFQRSNNTNIPVSVFIKNEKIRQAIPVSEFEVFTYEIDLDLDYDFSRQTGITVFLVKSTEHIRCLIDFVKSHQTYFLMDIVSSVSNLFSLIENGCLQIIGCNVAGKTLGYIFFRDFKNGTKHNPILDCICSLFDNEAGLKDSIVFRKAVIATFSRGIMLTIKSVSCRYLRVWTLGMNNRVIELFESKVKQYEAKETFYIYLYNYKTMPIKGEQILFLI